MKRHWMGSERKLAKKKRDMKLELQRNVFEKFKNQNSSMVDNHVVTSDVIALIGTLDLNEINKVVNTHGETKISFDDSLLDNEQVKPQEVEEEPKQNEKEKQEKATNLPNEIGTHDFYCEDTNEPDDSESSEVMLEENDFS